MAGHLLNPLRLDVGNSAAKQARGFHQFSGHNPAAGFFAQLGAGVAVKLDAACAQVGLVIFRLETQVAEQAAEHGKVQLLVAGRFVVEVPALLADDAVQLRMDVAPLAHAADVDVVLAQQVLVLPVRELVRRPFNRLRANGASARTHRFFISPC